MYDGVESKHKQHAIFQVVCQVKRIIHVVLMFYLQEHLILQLIIVLYLNVFSIIYQGKTKALEIRRDNNLEMLNEWLVTVAGLHIIVFSDFVPD